MMWAVGIFSKMTEYTNLLTVQTIKEARYLHIWTRKWCNFNLHPFKKKNPAMSDSN
jgi:hypothetical protein